MAGMYGADVEQLRALAKVFSDASDRLERDRMTVGNQIKINAWVGPVATQFRMQWDSEHSVRVASAVHLLAESATKLRKNAQEQEDASRSDGGAPWSAPGLGLLPFPGDLFKTLPYVVGHDGRIFREIHHVWDDASTLLNTEIPDIRAKIGDFAGLLPVIGSGVDIFNGIDKLTHGHVPWHESIDLAAGAARGSGNPIAFGLGWAAANIADGVEIATTEVDWSPKGWNDLVGGATSISGWQQVAHDMGTRLPLMLAGNTIP